MIQDVTRTSLAPSAQSRFLESYPVLRRVASRLMAQERSDHTLSATALLHEAYVKLAAGSGERQWSDEHHFIRSLARAMRSILVDCARRHDALKRGGGRYRFDLQLAQTLCASPPADILTIHEALNALAEGFPVHAELVQLVHFGGLSLAEAADTLGIAEKTAYKYHLFARARIYRWLHDDCPQG